MSSQNTSEPYPTTTTRKPRVSAQKRAGIHFPVSRITRLLREGKFASRYSVKASVYMAAVLEYLASELIDVAGCITLDTKKVVITPKHLLSGIQNDAELNQLMSEAPGGTQIADAGRVVPLPPAEDSS
ncbi:unnamed protein product [Absidia cylindrospora]